MSELTPQLVDVVVAACQANAGELAGALGRTLDAQFTISVGEPGTLTVDAIPAGPGLAALLTFGNSGMVAFLSEATGLIPAWCHNPDPTGKSKLSTLGQELSMLLVPDTLPADSFRAERVDDIRLALQNGSVAEDAVFLPLELKSGETTHVLQLVWPLATQAKLFGETKPVQFAASEPKPSDKKPEVASLAELPSYTRSLLKIAVPVSVVLATKKESVHDVVELAPGTIIKFSKSCEESLHLFVGDQQVAEGEAVKVGDKFGFRVTEMTMPAEHFLKWPQQAG
jgi:flagellar motor switch protein FliN/FliY